jgi:hypothetical protein
LGTAVLNFKVKSSQIIVKVAAEIEGVAMSKMGYSDSLDILKGGVSDINLLPVN